MEEFIKILKKRFEQNMNRHKNIKWDDVQAKIEKNTKKLVVIHKMEETGGEPDVIDYDKNTNEYIFCDCSKESPSGRRSLCYDPQAWESRKQNKPQSSAIEMAAKMGLNLLTEEQYRNLQKLGPIDTKTSSWILTPPKIRELGGSLFGDYRYGTVFIYHNGAESYYAARGFRGLVKI